MKIKYFINFAVISFLIIIPAFLINNVFAQGANSAADIQYPVAELGNCESEADCRTYCDSPKNTEKCLDFAQKNNLMSDEEISRAKKFLAASSDGPGGCQNKEECDAYCSDINHIDECISFAEENDLIPPEELEEAKKVQAAIRRGVKPPPCGSKEQCDAYCDEPEHMEECIAFGVEAGFIQGKEAEDAQKMLQAVKRGVKPPPCKGKNACDEYCSSPDNMEVCMNFAIEAGFMSEEEKEGAQKMLQALKKGVKPPPCRGKEECDVYCQQDEHFQECMDFAVAAGFMSEKDAEMARKTGGKGPGGCKGREECDAFCNNPDNQETCFQFGKDNGLIPEEDLKRMEEGKQQMKQTFEQMPSEVEGCLNGLVGADMVEKMKNGFMPPRETGDKMQECFQKMGPPPGQEGQGMMQPGPGEINPGGQMMPQQAGPGGCKTPEECQSFCQNNPEQCKNSGPGPNDQQPGQMPPCESENCQYGPPQGQPGEFQPPTGQQPQTPCQGENCQYGPSPGQQLPPPGDQQIPNQQISPPLTEPGAGGGTAPGSYVPPAEPAQQQPPQPAQEQAPPPPPSSQDLSPTGILNRVLYSFAAALSQFISK